MADEDSGSSLFPEQSTSAMLLELLKEGSLIATSSLSLTRAPKRRRGNLLARASSSATTGNSSTTATTDDEGTVYLKITGS